MTEITTKSGAQVVINPAPWKNAKELKKAIVREIIGSNSVDIDFANTASLAAMMLKIDGSDAVEYALWPCLIRCTRNGLKIEESIFDDVEARKDYYEIVIACVKENLSPLAESISSQFAGAASKVDMQESESPK